MINDYFSKKFQTPLEEYFPDVFAGLWACQADWVEPPNQRRGGWSGAKRIVLTLDGTSLRFFLKIQENHCSREWHPPFRLRPTFEQEARALIALNKLHVDVPELCYYGCRRTNGNRQALVLLPDLFEHRPLDELLETKPLKHGDRHRIFKAIGKALGRFHRVGWIHRHLIPNHILVKQQEFKTEVRIVDLEKARPMIMQSRDIIYDLARFHRKTPDARTADRIALLHGYCRCGKLGSEERRFIAKIEKHG